MLVISIGATLLGCGGGGDGDGSNVAPGTLLLIGEERTIEGTDNNPATPSLGAAGTQLMRLSGPNYADGVAAPVTNRPNTRMVSNRVSAEPVVKPNSFGLSSFLWQWGQFIDHDISLTPEASPLEPMDIPVPTGDRFFDPQATGDQVISFLRSEYDHNSGTDNANPRQQMNVITTFIDGSVIYGSDVERNQWLRTFSGGQLRTSAGRLLPFNDGSQENQGGNGSTLFVSGDIRANEQIVLTALHTLFVREHNRLVARFADEHPEWNDEQLFQHARRFIGGLLQAITYNEFLPALLGDGALSPYRGYDPAVNPSLSNEFTTAVFRFGHSLLPTVILRLDENGNPISAGNLPLRDAFFRPDRLVTEGGIAPLLRGLAAQPSAELDAAVTDEVRNFLFGQPGAGGFDLVSRNMQRGRDHGLPGFNALRRAYGLAPYTSFTSLAVAPETAATLAELYTSVDELDAWLGCLVERRMFESPVVGETQFAVMKKQFERLRDGDRFWFENDPNLSDAERAEIRRTRLSQVILRNTEIGSIQEDVFFVN